jgi:hypothetical protein
VGSLLFACHPEDKLELHTSQRVPTVFVSKIGLSLPQVPCSAVLAYSIPLGLELGILDLLELLDLAAFCASWCMDNLSRVTIVGSMDKHSTNECTIPWKPVRVSCGWTQTQESLLVPSPSHYLGNYLGKWVKYHGFLGRGVYYVGR